MTQLNDKIDFEVSGMSKNDKTIKNKGTITIPEWVLTQKRFRKDLEKIQKRFRKDKSLIAYYIRFLSVFLSLINLDFY